MSQSLVSCIYTLLCVQLSLKQHTLPSMSVSYFTAWDLLCIHVFPTCIPLPASKYSGKRECQEQAAVAVKVIFAR